MRLRNLTFPIKFLFIFIMPLFVYGQINDPRSGHNAHVLKAEFSKDNKMLASGDENGNIVVWNLLSNQLMYRISGSATESFSLQALSPDGKLLATTKDTLDGEEISAEEVWLWEAATGKSLGPLDVDASDRVAKVDFSPDSRTLVVQTTSKTSFWDMITKKEKEMPFEVDGPFAFSPTGSQFAAVDKKGKLNVWDMSTDRRIRSFENFKTLDSVIFNHSGTLLAGIESEEIGSTEGNVVKVWNLTSGLPVRSFAKVKADSICGFTADSRNLLVNLESSELNFTAEYGTLALLNTTTAAKTGGFLIETNFTGDLAGISSDLRLAAGTSLIDRDLHLFDLQKKTELPTLKGYSIKVNSMVFSPNTPDLIAAYDDQNVIAWNISSGKFQRLVTPIPKDASLTPDVRDVSLCPLANCIFSKSPVHFYNVQTGDQMDDFEDDLSDAAYIFGPSGKTLARISKETVSFYEVPTLHLKKRFVNQLPTFDLSLLRAAFSQDEKSLALEINSKIFIYDTVDGNQISHFSVREKEIASIGFMTDGKRLIVSPTAEFAKSDSGIGIYDISSGVILNRIAGQLQYFAVSPVGQTIATIGEDHKINFWDLSGEALKLKTKNDHKLDSYDNLLLFSPDGKQLAVGGNRGIKLFNTISGEEIYALQ